MKITKPFTLDNEIYARFEKTVASGERSQVIENLISEFIKLRNPDKKALKAERDAERKAAQERLDKLMFIEKEEADWVLNENASGEAKLIADQRFSSKQHFLDDCKRQAKLLLNVEFGLDPVTEIAPSIWTQDMRTKYRLRWKELTNQLIEKGKDAV